MIRGGLNMAGKSFEEQRAALRSLAESRDRGEADRARAVLLTLAGWTSPRIAEAFGVHERGHGSPVAQRLRARAVEALKAGDAMLVAFNTVNAAGRAESSGRIESHREELHDV